MTHLKNIFCPPKLCSDSLLWVLFFACLGFYCVFLQSCFYLCNIHHISNNLGTVLCKLVSCIGSSSDWGKSREKIGLSHTSRPKFRDTPAAALNLIRTQKHQQPTRSRAGRNLSELDLGVSERVWHVRKDVTQQWGHGTVVCRTVCPGGMSWKGCSLTVQEEPMDRQMQYLV